MWLFVYKVLLLEYKNCVSNYKVASHATTQFAFYIKYNNITKTTVLQYFKYKFVNFRYTKGFIGKIISN